MTERYAEWLELLAARDWALINFAAIAFVSALVWHIASTFNPPARRWTQRLMLAGVFLGVTVSLTIVTGGNMDILILFGVAMVAGGVAVLIFQPDTRRAIFAKLQQLTGKK